MNGGRRAGYALIAFAALLLVVAVVSGWRGASRLADRGDDTGAVSEAATDFVAAYGTFDFRAPEGYTARLRQRTTEPLRVELAAAALHPDAVSQQRSLTTDIESASVTALSKHEATVALKTRQQRWWVDRALGQSRHEEIRQIVVCRLVREDGRWLVAELRLQSEEPARREVR